MPANGMWRTLGRVAKVIGIIVAVAALGLIVYVAYVNSLASRRGGG